MQSIRQLLCCFGSGAIDAQRSFHHELDTWVAASPAREKRARAAEIIRSCHRRREATLSLSGLRLSSLPDCLGDLTHIHALQLSDNEFSRVPECVFALTNLVSLTLTRNQLRLLSPMIERLTHLEALLLDENALRQLPEGVCSLNHLTSLSVTANQLETLPDRIGELYHLRTLAVNDNQLAQLPDSIGMLRELRVLTLSNNQLQALPDSITDLPSLERLVASDNQLRGLPVGFELLEARVPTCVVRGNLLLPPAPRGCTHHKVFGAAFRDWYRRLERTQDYAVPHARANLIARLERLFAAIENDRELRHICLGIADEAIGACEDRVAWGLTQMDMALENRRAERGELTERDVFNLGRAQYRLAELHRLADAHVNTQARLIGRAPDAIEVHLAFQTGLRETLGLPLAIEGMLYSAGTRVQEWELANAEQRIRTSERSGVQRAQEKYLDAEAALRRPRDRDAMPSVSVFAEQRLAYSLAHYVPWQKHVERRHPERLKALQAAAQNFVARADTSNEGAYKRACDTAMFLHNHGLPYSAALQRMQGIAPANKRPALSTASR